MPIALQSWPFKILGVGGLAGSAVFLYLGTAGDYPEMSDLVKLTGPVERVVLRDDISGTTTGAILPGWSSVYITLEGHDGEFRYPRNHPMNDQVRYGTGGTLEIWVARESLGGSEPPVIWGLYEDNPYKRENSNSLGPETHISHEEILTRLHKIDRSLMRLAAFLGGGGALLLGFGILLKRTKRRRRDTLE